MSSSPVPQFREVWLDQLKAIAIIGVVLIHVGIPGSAMVRFCVPLFITLWAYSFENGLANRSVGMYRQYVRRRMVSLLIPYCFWSLIYCYLFRSTAEWNTTSWRTILGGWFGGYGWSGQYFFIVLFQLTLLFRWLRELISKENFKVTIAAGSIFNGVAAYYFVDDSVFARLGDRVFVYWLPFCVLGIAFARKYFEVSTPLLIPALLLLMFAPIECASLPNSSPYLVPSVVFGSLFLFFSVGPGWKPSFLWHPPIAAFACQVMQTIGRNTMPIFLTNPMMITFFKYCGFFSSESFSIGVLSQIVVTGLTITAGVCTSSVLRYFRMGILVGSSATVSR